MKGVYGSRDHVHAEVTANGSEVLFVVRGERNVAIDALAAYVLSLKDKALGQ